MFETWIETKEINIIRDGTDLHKFLLKREIKQVSALKSCNLGFNLVAMRLSDRVKMMQKYHQVIWFKIIFLMSKEFFFEIIWAQTLESII